MELRHEIVEDIADLRFTAGFAALQFVDEHAQMAHPRARRDVFAHLRVEGDEPHAVLLAEHEVREARRQPRARIPYFVSPPRP